MEIEILELTQKLMAFASILQMIEYFLLRDELRDQGVWSWKILGKEHEASAAAFWGWFFAYPHVLVLLSVGLLSAFGMLFRLEFATPLLLVTMMMSLRFRGTFNGGSDYMSFIILMGLSLSALTGSLAVVKIALAYIGVQAFLSYFMAGMVKIKNRDWRSGRALSLILLHSHYDVPKRVQEMAGSLPLVRAAAWAAMIFELSFFLAFLSPKLWAVYAAVGFLFHFANVYVFGLNRFLWVWLAAYPAVYYCGTLIV